MRENGVKERYRVWEKVDWEGKRERWREKKSRVWKVCLNIPSYTVELRGTERRGALESGTMGKMGKIVFVFL